MRLNVKSAFFQVIAAIAVIVLFSLFIHSRLFNIPDADAFYHIKHSWIYNQNGVTFNEFPWAQFSVVKKYAADLWYGFHVLGMPLAGFSNLLNGIKTGGIIVTIISLLLAWWAFVRLRIRWPLFWMLTTALLSADALYRLTMFRPHPISVGLSLLLFSFFAVPAAKRNWLFILAASFFFGWLHLSLVWVPLAVWLAVNFSRASQKLTVNWQSGAALTGGLLLGWLARPNPLGAAKLAYVQVLKLLVEKQSDLPIRFGRELKPFVWENFVDQLIPISILLAIAIFFWLRIYSKNRALLPSAEIRATILSSLIISAAFFALAFVVARRANDFFIPFTAVFLALTFNVFLEARRKGVFKNAQPALAVIATMALIWAPLKNYYRFETYVPNAFPPERFREVGEWMRDNLPDNKIVFNSQWDRFAELFFWNHENYYINGMDPIFEFAYDRSLYWKNHFLHTDSFYTESGVAKICGDIRCTAESVENIHTVFRRDFNADYIFIEKRRNPKLFEYLQSASGFEKIYNSDIAAIYKL